MVEMKVGIAEGKTWAAAFPDRTTMEVLTDVV